jgi:hypothetical protein
VRHWPVHQLDVKNAFLYGNLAKHVYCQQLAGFVDNTQPDHVCLLVESLYGLNQTLQAWFQHLEAHLRSIGLLPTGSDSSLFVYRSGDAMAYLLLIYVDDIILTASTTPLLQCIIHYQNYGVLLVFLSSIKTLPLVIAHKNLIRRHLVGKVYTKF